MAPAVWTKTGSNKEGGKKNENFGDRRSRLYRKPYVVELLNAGYDVVVVDNLYNASEKSLERVKEITGEGSDVLQCRYPG